MLWIQERMQPASHGGLPGKRFLQGLFTIVFGNQVARGEHGGVEPLVFGRLFRIDAQNENQFIDDGLSSTRKVLVPS